MNAKPRQRKPDALDREILREFEDALTAEEFMRDFPFTAEEIERSPAYIAEGAKIGFVEQVLQALKRKRWNKSNLAQHVGHSRQFIQEILDDKCLSNFTVDTMAKVAAALDMSLEIVLTPSPVSLSQNTARPRSVASLPSKGASLAAGSSVREAAVKYRKSTPRTSSKSGQSPRRSSSKKR